MKHPTLTDTFKEYKETENPQLLIPLYNYINKISEIQCFKMKVINAKNDISMDSFIRAVKYKDTFDAKKARFETWSSRIIYNEILQMFRYKSKFTEQTYNNYTNVAYDDSETDIETEFNYDDLVEAYNKVVDNYIINTFTDETVRKDAKIILDLTMLHSYHNKKIQREYSYDKKYIMNIVQNFKKWFKKSLLSTNI